MVLNQYYGLTTNLDDLDNYYKKKHEADSYISEMTYELEDELEELYPEIRENGKYLDFYNNGYYIEEYKYDPAGNAWKVIDYQYNAANQVTKAGKREYQYDKNGNLE